MQIEGIKSGFRHIVGGYTSQKPVSSESSPATFLLQRGYGELALRGGRGSLGSVAKIFLFTQKIKS